MRVLRITLAVVALGVLSAAAGYLVQRSMHDTPTANVVQGMRPAFTLADMSGAPRSAEEWDGKVVVVNFWATWCPPCRREIPTLNALQADYGQRGLQVIGVAIDSVDAVRRYMETTPLDYVVLIGDQEAIELARALGNRADVLPFTAVIDRQGQITANHPGELVREHAEEVVLPLL